VGRYGTTAGQPSIAGERLKLERTVNASFATNRVAFGLFEPGSARNSSCQSTFCHAVHSFIHRME
jgi:hypothetical protein